MKKYTLILMLLLLRFSSNGQMTLAHTFPKPALSEGEIIDLSISGKKIMTFTDVNILGAADTIYFYNMDYSLWKTIPCPGIPGFTGKFNRDHEIGKYVGIHYPSETLFNTDLLLEVAVYYASSPTGKYLIINETGAIVDSIVDVMNPYCTAFKVQRVDTLGLGYQAIVPTTAGIKVYNLPGTLPCVKCNSGGGETVGVNENSDNISTKLFPNPSINEVKITFALPEGASRGELCLYNSNGQKIKTYEVDNRFGFVLLDNSQLSPGVYFYNIVANGVASSTQKMVVIK